MKKMNKKGFTLVEIMIVVAIIGLLAAIGIPSFTKARATSQKRLICNNLRLVDAGIEQYTMENNLTASTDVTYADAIAYARGGTISWPSGVTAPADTAKRAAIKVTVDSVDYTLDNYDTF